MAKLCSASCARPGRVVLFVSASVVPRGSVVDAIVLKCKSLFFFLRFSSAQNNLRHNVAAGLVSLGAIFWSIPVLLIQVGYCCRGLYRLLCCYRRL